MKEKTEQNQEKTEGKDDGAVPDHLLSPIPAPLILNQSPNAMLYKTEILFRAENANEETGEAMLSRRALLYRNTLYMLKKNSFFSSLW
jgi:hypothetical protein